MDGPKPLIAVCLLAFFAAGCDREPETGKEPVRGVRAMRVFDLEGVTSRSFPGRATATQEVDLAFRVSGPLVARPVNIGDEIKAGDLVARIDPRDFQVSLRNAEGTLERARANQQRTQIAFDRNVEIQNSNPGAIAQAVIDESREILSIAKGDVAALEASVDAAKDALSDTDLVAPFAGTIVAAYVENFQNVREKQKIARLLDTTRIEFIIQVPESLISMTPYVEDIFVQFDAFENLKVPAEIKEVGAEASESTRTFPVTLIMDQPEGVRILPGMAGRVEGVARPPQDSETAEIVIPVTAVFSPESDAQTYVWIIDESSNQVKRRRVQLGNISNGGYLIESGLTATELIAAAGVHFLVEGQTVSPSVE